MRSQVLAAMTFALSLNAQAPDAGPLILLLPASARATALGNAWTAGRDEDVIFYNPAQITARTGFNASLGRYGSNATIGSVAGAYAAGPWTLTTGWGVQYLNYHAPAGAYPYTPAQLANGSGADATGMLATVGAAITKKSWRVGVAAKYATDRVSDAATHDAYVADIGIAHALLSGQAGLSFQNLGSARSDSGPVADLPVQTSLGWTLFRPVGQLDIGIATSIVARGDWIAPGGGIEVGYGWIEGYSASFRVGARKTETTAEKPVAIGGTFNADHLSLEYALQFFAGDTHLHRVTIRWR